MKLKTGGRPRHEKAEEGEQEEAFKKKFAEKKVEESGERSDKPLKVLAFEEGGPLWPHQNWHSKRYCPRGFLVPLGWCGAPTSGPSSTRP